MNNKLLYNQNNKEHNLDLLKREKFERITLSFYKYIKIDNLEQLRDNLFLNFNELKILGRIYIANEGINAQVSIPEHNLDMFKTKLNSYSSFNNIPFKFAVIEGLSFLKLTIKIKKEIVAYKIPANQYDLSKTGKHLKSDDFNQAIDDGAIIIDMRNYYEGEIGKFENAIIPDVERSQELLPEIKKLLSKNKEDKILMYCTGGIRCEKASSYLIKNGFQDVNQLEGGIIQYANDIKKNKTKSKFIGKNFVFDHRMGERITDDIIANCHQCDVPSDNHTNCMNQCCHILFIQCSKCKKEYNNCCSLECSEFLKLPKDQQQSLFKNGEVMFTAQKSKNIKPKLYLLNKNND